MTNDHIFETALVQSAIDCGCAPSDFLGKENVVVISKKNEKARRYLDLPFSCNLVSYGNNIVASVSEALADDVKKYIDTYPAEHCFETPNMHVLDALLAKYGEGTCFMAEYFLPDVSKLRELPCDLKMKLLFPSDFGALYLPEWSNALCEKRKELDVLGVGAYDGDTLVGFAACSADCGTMWQIGIDVLPGYRRRGIASALTSRLALEIIERGKVPFYCAAWSNVKSVRNAIKCGFRPAWVELTAKKTDFICKMNER